MRYYKPIEIARELQISTSALRHYESWGVVPAPSRAANGYRLYTKLHLAYFRCLRAMSPGFGVGLTCDVLRHIQNANTDAAFWLVNKQQAILQQDKNAASQTLDLLQNLDLPTVTNKKTKSHMTIGEVAAFTGVTTSAIRHWEKEGLLTPARDPENGYRLFTQIHIRKILLIRTLRSTVYFLSNMKEILHAVENQSIEHAKKVTEDAILSIYERNRHQFRGIHQLVELCKELELL
ncbi:TioE family transcriptional regulator [Paenibacillus contaminans]|uniref:Transcriptional regulator n=1 Tax=Paenibacillus contaminans TaxID=450362 RepID=A0A329MTK8_9BACL|nr:TioE family transcriptional regulator [Paenibacillus contaminans]RAV22942.1 transcriptional regulator [Paenibacillus contaminans]